MTQGNLVSGFARKSTESKYDEMKQIVYENIQLLGKNLKSSDLRQLCFEQFIQKNNVSPWTAKKYYQKVIQDVSLIVDSSVYVMDILNDQVETRKQLQDIASAEVFQEITDRDGNVSKEINTESAKVKIQALKGKNDINKAIGDIVLKNQGNKNQQDRNKLLDDRNNIDKDRPEHVTNININADDLDMSIIQLLQADKQTARKIQEEFDDFFAEVQDSDILESSSEIASIEDGH